MKPFDTITLLDVATFPRPGTSVPSKVGFTPDGRRVTYLWSAAGSLVQDLWACDLAGGAPARLGEAPAGSADEAGVSREEALRRERARLRELGITEYAFAEEADPPVLLVPVGGRLLVRRGEGRLEPVDGADGGLDARLSRDGARLGFVRDDEVFVADLATGAVRRLTHGAEPGLTHGVAEFAAHEELGRAHGWWFSHDGALLAYVEADSRHIPELPIVHQGAPRVDVERHRYPFAGEPNARVRLGVVPTAGGATTWLELDLHDGAGADLYLARVAWRPDGALAAAVLTRDQRRLVWFVFDPGTGQRRVLLEERQAPWVNLDHDTRFLETGEVLFSSERTGWRHLYLLAAGGGEPRALTAGPWMVTRLCALDEERRVAWFEATADGPLERHVYAVPLAGGPPRRLTAERGTHAATFARDHRHFVDTWSSLEHAPRVAVRELPPADAPGAAARAVRVLHDDPQATAEALGLAPPRPVRVLADDGETTLHGLVYAPPPGPAGPAVVAVYGGPHAQMARDDWLLTVDLRAQHLARRGFTVLKLDNRGSANRGLAFEAALARRMGTVEVEDQLAGARWLQAQPGVDPARVGVYGWSYGGYMTLLCMLRAPEVFKVGVAGAPVTDWDGYDTAYTERYMGRPRDNPEGYREGSVLTHVERLAGQLLLVHGMVDENVHFRHTARLLVALARANKRCELLALPEERHMPRDRAGLLYLETRLFEFFRAHL